MTRTLLKETVVFLTDKAVFLPEHRTLVLSDVHLGKAGTFRANGIPVPEGDNARDLARITRLAESTSAQQIVIAGDLIHARSGLTRDLLSLVNTWARRTSANVVLVTGNHDAKALRGEDLGFPTTSSLALGEMHVVHDPADAAGGNALSICGHIHPVVKIREARSRSVRVPCFWLSDNVLTLPSFGSFTGGYVIKPKAGDQVFASLGPKVVEIPQKLVV